MHVRLEHDTSPAGATSDAVTVVVLDPHGRLSPEVEASLPPGLRTAIAPLPTWAGTDEATRVRVVTEDGPSDVVLIRPLDHGADALCAALISAGSRGALAGRIVVHGPWVSAGAGQLRAAVEGLHLGAYRFTDYQSRPTDGATIEGSFVVGKLGDQDRADFEQALERACANAAATNWARTLVDTPPGDSTPHELARLITERLSAAGVDVRVWPTSELVERGFGGVVAVGAGSAHPPCLVELTLRTGVGDRVVLCGKGVTFDAGGLSIKNDRTQTWMKADMAGAAAVAATMEAAARTGLKVNATALLPLVENLPSATAMRPGDVLRHPDHSTTEVTNTDAEGRLILADALAYARALNPAAVLDVATLTSGILGRDLWMLFSNDEDLAAELLEAGDEAGEPGWRLPLLDSMARPLHSTLADRKNYSFDHGHVDTLCAAAYLRGFTADVPWAHLDIVGSAFRTTPDTWPAGATGSPTRTLLRFLQGRSIGEVSVDAG
ncbi:MAG: leucyl aminopeptidase family protein [Nocardioidaceae bacterium]